MSDEFVTYPWSEILNFPTRGELIQDVLFTAGVTTLVGLSGKGKTTLAHSIGMSVGTGSPFGGRPVAQREANWIAGEGQYGLQPLYKAWLQEHPLCPAPIGWWRGQPVNFYDTQDTDKLLRKLEGKPPVQITSDALSQMLAGNDENWSKDVSRVYANVWRVVNYNGAAFVVLHHSGWDEIRERGSTAIRDNSDIVIQITEWNPGAGRIMLKHQKRREGVPLQEFGYGLKLVSVPGYRQPVPICTVERLDAGYAVLDGVPPEYGHAAKIVEIVVRLFSKGARTEELNRQFQEETKLKRQTFYNGLNCAIEKGWIVGNGPYNLNPDGCWKEVLQKPLLSTGPLKGGQSGWRSPMDSNWSNGQPESCEDDDATGSAEKLSQINEPESSVDPGKMTDLEREIWEQLKRKNAGDSTQH